MSDHASVSAPQPDIGFILSSFNNGLVFIYPFCGVSILACVLAGILCVGQ